MNVLLWWSFHETIIWFGFYFIGAETELISTCILRKKVLEIIRSNKQIVDFTRFMGRFICWLILELPSSISKHINADPALNNLALDPKQCPQQQPTQQKQQIQHPRSVQPFVHLQSALLPNIDRYLLSFLSYLLPWCDKPIHQEWQWSILQKRSSWEMGSKRIILQHETKDEVNSHLNTYKCPHPHPY